MWIIAILIIYVAICSSDGVNLNKDNSIDSPNVNKHDALEWSSTNANSAKSLIHKTATSEKKANSDRKRLNDEDHIVSIAPMTTVEIEIPFINNRNSYNISGTNTKSSSILEFTSYSFGNIDIDNVMFWVYNLFLSRVELRIEFDLQCEFMKKINNNNGNLQFEQQQINSVMRVSGHGSNLKSQSIDILLDISSPTKCLDHTNTKKIDGQKDRLWAVIENNDSDSVILENVLFNVVQSSWFDLVFIFSNNCDKIELNNIDIDFSTGSGMRDKSFSISNSHRFLDAQNIDEV